MPVNILYSIFIGLVQGVSEWLPISSKTQVLFATNLLFGLPLNVGYAFGLFMEVGSLGSAVTYFRRDILALFKDRKLLVYLLLVTVVTGVVGVPLLILAERLLENAYNLGIPMALLGSVLILDGVYIRYSRLKPRLGGLGDMRLKHYFAVGIAQGLAALPGVSRSGMTVSTMLFMGVDPKAAFRLSYLAYIPSAIGAFLATIVFSPREVQTAVSSIEVLGAAIAMLSAAVVGVAVIAVLLKFAGKNSIYVVTIALGVLALTIGLLATFGSV